MKFFTTLSLVFTCWILNAQCPSGDIVLLSQAEVDTFVVTYPNCTEINGDLQIGLQFDPSDIADISGLSTITSVENLIIADNPLLTDLGGLSAISSVNDLRISSNAILANLNGLSGLSFIHGNLLIEFNAALTDLDGLSEITSLGGELRLRANTSLTDISALSGITSVGTNLRISGPNAFTHLGGLENISSVGGNLELWSTFLTDISALSGITSIGGYLDIYNNASLTSLMGLDNLASIGGYLLVSDNATLTSIASLDNLTSIDGVLQIFSNTALMSLTGLDNLDATTITGTTFLEGLYIGFNPQLSACAIESICDYLGVALNEGTITDNAIGCATREEVETACVVSITDISQTDIKLFPNPTSGRLQLRNITAEHVDVFTSQGQRIARYESPGQELDLSALPAGVYHLHLIAPDSVYVAKVVKR
jgi:hypothetical protein